MEILEQDAEVLRRKIASWSSLAVEMSLAGDDHLAGGGALEPAQDHQQRGLAAARGSDDRRHLAAIHLERDILEDVQHRLAAHQLEVGVFGFDDGHGHWRSDSRLVYLGKRRLLRR